jgi:DNA-binding transcriptional regulator LsrR (DeoR family)
MTQKADKTFYRHMNQDKAEEIRRLYFSRVLTQKQLAEKYQISQSAVCRIISGWTWRKK